MLLNQVARPVGRRRWLVVVLLSGLLVTNFVERVNFSVAGPLLIRDLALSPAEFGFLLSAFQGAYAIAALFVGPLVDVHGSRRSLSIAAVAWSTLAIGTGLVRDFFSALVVRTALGVADAPMYPAMIKAINAWFPDRERGTAIGICQAAFYTASGLSAPLIAVLMLAVGWPTMFVIVGIIGLIPVLAWILIYREPDDDVHLKKEEQAYIRTGQLNYGSGLAAPGGAGMMRDWAGLFRKPTVLLMLASGFFLQFAMGFYLWVPVYLQQARGVSILQAGLLTALPYIGGAVGEILGGQISDRMVRRGIDPFRARRATIASGAVLTALAMGLMALADSLAAAIALLTLGMFANGVGNGSFHILPTVIASSRRFVASLSSIQNFGGLAALAVAPLSAGLMVEAFDSFVPVFVISGLCSVLAAWLYWFVMQRRLEL